MTLFTALLDLLARHARWWLASGVLIGLAVPPLADAFRPLLVPVIFINLTLSLLRLDFADVLGYLRRPLLSGWFVAACLLLSPVAMWLVCRGLGLPEGLATALVLMCAAPPIMSSPAFALIMGLDAAFSVSAVLLTHLLVPLTLPVLALVLLGLDLPIGVATFMGRLAALVGGAFLSALVLKRWVLPQAWLDRQARRLDGLAVLILVVFGIAIMKGAGPYLLQEPLAVGLVTLAAVVANVALQTGGALLFLKSGRKVAFTAGHMLGNCNMGMVLAVLADRASFEVVLFFAMAQLPMYMLPTIAVPIYRRLL